MFCKPPLQKTLDKLLIAFENETPLREKKGELFNRNIFKDEDLIYDENSTPTLEEILDLAKKKNNHFLVIYSAIMTIKIENRLKCNKCDKRFPTKYQLEQHIQKCQDDDITKSPDEIPNAMPIRKRRPVNFSMQELRLAKEDTDDPDYVPPNEPKKIDLIGEYQNKRRGSWNYLKNQYS